MSVGTITWIHFCLNWQMLLRHLSLFVRITVRLIPKYTRWDLACVNSGGLTCTSHIFVVSVCRRRRFNWAPWVECIAFTSTSLSLSLCVWLSCEAVRSSASFISFLLSPLCTKPTRCCLPAEKHSLISNLLVLHSYADIADCHSDKGSVWEFLLLAQRRRWAKWLFFCLQKQEIQLVIFGFVFFFFFLKQNTRICSNCCIN